MVATEDAASNRPAWPGGSMLIVRRDPKDLPSDPLSPYGVCVAQLVGEGELAATGAGTIGALWRSAVESERQFPAFLVQADGGWAEVSWTEAAERVTALANGFLSLGVVKGDRVAILCRTRLEWTLTDYALA